MGMGLKVQLSPSGASGKMSPQVTSTIHTSQLMLVFHCLLWSLEEVSVGALRHMYKIKAGF